MDSRQVRFSVRQMGAVQTLQRHRGCLLPQHTASTSCQLAATMQWSSRSLCCKDSSSSMHALCCLQALCM